jgi:hypothetical protein
METSASAPFEKTTVVPIYYTVWNTPFLAHPPSVELPLDIIQGVTLENMEGTIGDKNFDLWKEQISAQDRKGLAYISTCLVNRFKSHWHVGLPEQESQQLLYKVFTCLRIVKPTRSAYRMVQFKLEESGGVDVFRFTHPDRRELNVPDAETLNVINPKDIDALRKVISPFLHITKTGPDNLRRAIQLFEEGYSEVSDPALQLLVWMMGLDAAFAKGDEPLRRDVLLQTIEREVGFHRNIYEDSGGQEFIDVPSPLTVGETIHDLFKLRNHLAHGGWIDKDWAARKGRLSISGGTVPYADVLREAASFILRKSILSTLTAPQR